MKRWQKTTFKIFTVLLLLIGAAIGGLHSLLQHMCVNDAIVEVISPDQKIKAVVFRRNCGATTDFGTHVSITSTSQILPKRSGNLFVADTDHGNAPFGPDGSLKVEAVWRNTATLIIRHHRKARVFKALRELKGINVSYQTY
jgi:hypothetical protein